MFTPTVSPLSLKKATKQPVQSFSILSWNIHKQTLHRNFNRVIQTLDHHHPSDFLLLQEAKVNRHQDFSLTGYSYVTAPNMQISRHVYGVLTATHQAFLQTKALLTKARESWWATRKSALITYHPMHDEKTLLVANIHAINFTTNRWFHDELDRLYQVVDPHQGPMIIAGDFNTWNHVRLRSLKDFSRKLGVSSADITKGEHATRFMFYRLDHILYRGLELVDAYAIDTGNFSDHNPLYARFV